MADPFDPKDNEQWRKIYDQWSEKGKTGSWPTKYENLGPEHTSWRGTEHERLEQSAYEMAIGGIAHDRARARLPQEEYEKRQSARARTPMTYNSGVSEESESNISRMRREAWQNTQADIAGSSIARKPMTYIHELRAAAGRAANAAIGGYRALPPRPETPGSIGDWLRNPGMRSYDTIVSELRSSMGEEAVTPGARKNTSLFNVGGNQFVLSRGPGGGALINGRQVPAQVTYTGQDQYGHEQYSTHRPSEWLQQNASNLSEAIRGLPSVGDEYIRRRMGPSQESKMFSATIFNAAEGLRNPYPSSPLPGGFATRRTVSGGSVVGFDPQAANRAGLRPVDEMGNIYSSAATVGKSVKSEQNLFTRARWGNYSTMGRYFDERTVFDPVGAEPVGSRMHGGQRGFVYITPSQSIGEQEGMQYMRGGGRMETEKSYRVALTTEQFERFAAGKLMSQIGQEGIDPDRLAALQQNLNALPSSARENPLQISGYGEDAPWSPSNRALQLGPDLRLPGGRQPGIERRVTNIRPDIDTQSLLVDVQERSGLNPLMSAKTGGVKGYIEQVGGRIRSMFQPTRLSNLNRPGLEGLSYQNLLITGAKDVGVAALNSLRAMTPGQVRAIADIQVQKAGFKRGAGYLRQIASSAVTEGGQTVMSAGNLNARARTAVAKTLADYFTVYSNRDYGGKTGGQIGYMFPTLHSFSQEFLGPRPNLNAETMAGLRMAGNTAMADYLSGQGAGRQERAISFLRAQQSNELQENINIANPIGNEELQAAAPGIYAAMQEAGEDTGEPQDRTRAFIEQMASMPQFEGRSFALGVGGDQKLFTPSVQDIMAGGGRAAVGRGFASPLFGSMARAIQTVAAGESEVSFGQAGSKSIGEYASGIASQMSERIQSKKFRRALTGTEPGFGAYFPVIGSPDVAENEVRMSMRDMMRASGMSRSQVTEYLAQNEGVMPMWGMRQPNQEATRGGGMILGARLGKAGQAPMVNALAMAAQRGDTDPDHLMMMAAVNRATGQSLASISTPEEIRAMAMGNASREGEGLAEKRANYMSGIGADLNLTAARLGKRQWTAAGRSFRRAAGKFSGGLSDIFGLKITPEQRAAESQNVAMSKGGMGRSYNSLFRRLQFTMNAQNAGQSAGDPRLGGFQAMVADVYQRSLDLKGVEPHAAAMMDILGNTSMKGGSFIQGSPKYFQGGPPDIESGLLTEAVGMADVLRGDADNQDLYQTQLKGIADILTPVGGSITGEGISEASSAIHGILGGSGSVAARVQQITDFYGSNQGFARTPQERFWGGGGAQPLLHKAMGEAMAERSLKQMSTREDYLSGRRPSAMSETQHASAMRGRQISELIATIGKGKANTGNLSVGGVIRSIINPGAGLFGDLGSRIYGGSLGKIESHYLQQSLQAASPNNLIVGAGGVSLNIDPNMTRAQGSAEETISSDFMQRVLQAKKSGRFGKNMGAKITDSQPMGEEGSDASSPPQPPTGGPPPVIGAGGMYEPGSGGGGGQGGAGGGGFIPHYGESRTRAAQVKATALQRAVAQFMGVEQLTPEAAQGYVQQMGGIQREARGGGLLPKKLLSHVHQVNALIKGARIPNPQEDEMDLPAGRALSAMTSAGTPLGDVMEGLTRTQSEFSQKGSRVTIGGDLEASYLGQKASGQYSDVAGGGSRSAASLDRINKKFEDLNNMLEMTGKSMEEISGQKGQTFLGWLQDTVKTVGQGEFSRPEAGVLRKLLGTSEVAAPGIATADRSTREAMIAGIGRTQGAGAEALMATLYGGDQPAASGLRAQLGEQALTGRYAQRSQGLMGMLGEMSGNATDGWKLFMANRLWSFGGRPVAEAMKEYGKFSGELGGAMVGLGTPEWEVGGMNRQSMMMQANMSNAQLAIGRAGMQAWMPAMGMGANAASGGVNALSRSLAILGPSAALGGTAATMAPAAIAGPVGLAVGVGAAAIGMAGTTQSQLGDASERARIAYQMSKSGKSGNILEMAGTALSNIPEAITYDAMLLRGDLGQNVQMGEQQNDVVQGHRSLSSLPSNMRAGAFEMINQRMGEYAPTLSEQSRLGLTTYYMRAYGQQANWSTENYGRMADIMTYNPQAMSQLQDYTSMLGASPNSPAAMRQAEQRITGMNDTISRDRILGGVSQAMPLIQSMQRMGNTVTRDNADQLALQMNDYNNPNQILTNQALSGIQGMKEDIFNKVAATGKPGWFANLTSMGIDRSLNTQNYFERAPLIQSILGGDQQSISEMFASTGMKYRGTSLQTRQVKGQGTEGAPIFYDYASQADAGSLWKSAGSYMGGLDKVAESVKKGVMDAFTGAGGGAGGSLGLAQYKSSLQNDWMMTQQKWAQQDFNKAQAVRTGVGLGAFGVSAENQIGDEELARRRMGISQQRQSMQITWQGQDMAMQQKQFAENWNFGMNRMMFNFGTQQQQMQFNRSQQVTQQGWAQEDLSFNRAQSQLQFGWQMQDMDESIRMSQNGRERRSMIKQQQRATISYAMQQGQYDKQDERQQKQAEWTEQQYKMDQRNFEANKRYSIEEANMNKRHFEERMQLDRQRFQMNVQWERQLMQLDQQEFNRNIQLANAQAKIDAERMAAANAYNQRMAAIAALEAAIAVEREKRDRELYNFLRNDLGYLLNTVLPQYLDNLASHAGSGGGGNTGVGGGGQPNDGGGGNPPKIPGDDDDGPGGKGGYAQGGFTGYGPRNQVAGEVHKGEHVIPSEGLPVIRGDNPESVRILGQILAVLERIGKNGLANINISTNDPQTAVRESGKLVDAARRMVK